MQLKSLISLFLIVLLAIIFSGFNLMKNENTPLSDKETHSAAENYRRFCAGCHGDNLEKFKSKSWMDEKGNKSAANTIKNGIADLGMPTFGKIFSESEVEALAAYVKKGIPEDRTLLKPAVSLGSIVESEVQRFVVDTVVTGLKVPWGLAFLPGGDMLISERAGSLYRFSNGKLSQPLEGVPEVLAKGQGGLMDICLHPDYEKNGWIYFSYASPKPGSDNLMGNTAIFRARLKGYRLTDQQVIFKGSPETNKYHHYGGKLAFDKQGHLYFGVGDRGQHFDFPQKLDNTNGKMHRINDDGTIPTDNPFVNTPGAVPSVYSYGHRNPQGTCIHPITGELWETEHGPMGGDELNLIVAGGNYGWPVICYGINYDGTVLTEFTEKEGMEQPVYYWLPSIAPCGMTFLTGNRYKKWGNNLFVGSLRFKYLERIVLRGHAVQHHEKLLINIGRVRNVAVSPDGLIYVAIETPGKIVRLVPVD
jgi:glucose/arabinose dehydrogenase